jgi:hypothetical protein
MRRRGCARCAVALESYLDCFLTQNTGSNLCWLYSLLPHYLLLFPRMQSMEAHPAITYLQYPPSPFGGFTRSNLNPCRSLTCPPVTHPWHPLLAISHVLLTHPFIVHRPSICDHIPFPEPSSMSPFSLLFPLSSSYFCAYPHCCLVGYRILLSLWIYIVYFSWVASQVNLVAANLYVLVIGYSSCASSSITCLRSYVCFIVGYLF